MPANDIRLYPAEEVLNIASRLQRERSILAKTIAAVVSDREAVLGQREGPGLSPMAGRPDRGPRRPTGRGSQGSAQHLREYA